MKMNICPFCGQGRIYRVRQKPDISEYSDSQIIRFCDECEGIWKLDEPITDHTGSSLHRLAHDLGIPEALLWNDMEIVQIELLYDDTEKTLQVTDFQTGGSSCADYSAEDSLWGQNLHIDVFFSDALGKTADTLAAALPAINNKLAFLEELEDNIKRYTVEGAHAVTPECFTASLYPVAMGFVFKDSTERSQAYLELGCRPDYIAGHRIRITINEQYRIECEGI